MTNITLKKISEVLGISISTVSRALKNHPDISEKTKKKVTELANSLDYEPNANAIHLRTSKSNILGIIVPSIVNNFNETFIASLEEECRKNNFSLMALQSGDDPEIETMNIKLCRHNRISGIFVSISSQTENIDAFMKLKEVDVPVIFIDKVPANAQCSKVCFDDYESAKIAAENIITSGKKNILAIFGKSTLSITQKREKAFMDILKHHSNIKITTLHAENTTVAEKMTFDCLSEPHDLVFCMSDEILIGSMKAIQKKKLTIPKDISVIAISNGFIPNLFDPAITYVETSGHKLGKVAYSIMMKSLADISEIHDITLEATLVPGGSV